MFYCAGLTADYAARPFETVEAHVTLLARLLAEARFERLVYLSSTRLYDSLGADGGREDDALRLDPANPRSLYDLSKALGETLCLNQSGGRAAVARLSGVYDWRPGAPGFLSEWLQKARASRTVELDSATGVVRDYIHLDDAAAALRAILDSRESRIVNVASGENLSNEDLAAIFARHGWRTSFARTAPRQAAPVCDITRLRSLGMTPRSVGAVLDEALAREDFREAR
ncbi:MAG: NAD-dependent epimerase/dehydratase family protein [Caulobacteraceae bacterium]